MQDASSTLAPRSSAATYCVGGLTAGRAAMNLNPRIKRITATLDYSTRLNGLDNRYTAPPVTGYDRAGHLYQSTTARRSGSSSQERHGQPRFAVPLLTTARRRVTIPADTKAHPRPKKADCRLFSLTPSRADTGKAPVRIRAAVPFTEHPSREMASGLASAGVKYHSPADAPFTTTARRRRGRHNALHVIPHNVNGLIASRCRGGVGREVAAVPFTPLPAALTASLWPEARSTNCQACPTQQSGRPGTHDSRIGFNTATLPRLYPEPLGNPAGEYLRGCAETVRSTASVRAVQTPDHIRDSGFDSRHLHFTQANQELSATSGVGSMPTACLFHGEFRWVIRAGPVRNYGKAQVSDRFARTCWFRYPTPYFLTPWRKGTDRFRGRRPGE